MKAGNTLISFTRYGYRQDSCTEAPIIHAHPQYEIGYIHSGEMSYMLGGRRILVESGDLILLSGLATHGLYAPERGMISSKFVFDPQLAQVFKSAIMTDSPLGPIDHVRNARVRLGKQEREECERILNQVNRFYGKHDEIQMHRMLVAFYDLLLFIGGQYGMSGMESSPPSLEKERLANEIVQFIDQNFMDEVRLDRMEMEFFISKYHLSRTFREITGLSIFEYLCHKRIEKAKQLLQHDVSENVVSDVCYRVGYNHPAHFSRVFKKLVGVSPIQYRKLMK